MKAKNLVRILQGLAPDAQVIFSLGETEQYRDDCAKAQLVTGECLGFLAVQKIEIRPGNDQDDEVAEIILEQDNIIYLDKEAKDFDNKYKAL